MFVPGAIAATSAAIAEEDAGRGGARSRRRDVEDHRHLRGELALDDVAHRGVEPARRVDEEDDRVVVLLIRAVDLADEVVSRDRVDVVVELDREDSGPVVLALRRRRVREHESQAEHDQEEGKGTQESHFRRVRIVSACPRTPCDPAGVLLRSRLARVSDPPRHDLAAPVFRLASSRRSPARAPASAGGRAARRGTSLFPPPRTPAEPRSPRVLPARTAPLRFNLVGLHWRGSGHVSFRTATRDRPLERLACRGARGGGRARRRHGRAEAPLAAGGSAVRTGRARATRIQYRIAGSVTRLRAFFLWSPEVAAAGCRARRS